MKILLSHSLKNNNNIIQYLTLFNISDYIQILQNYKNKKSTLYETCNKLANYQKYHIKVLQNKEGQFLYNHRLNFPKMLLVYLINCKMNKNVIRSSLYSYLFNKIDKKDRAMLLIFEYIGINEDSYWNFVKIYNKYDGRISKNIFIGQLVFEDFCNQLF